MTIFLRNSFILFSILSFNILTAQEICDNGIDDDGDGNIDLNDPDCFCTPVSVPPLSYIPNPSFEDTLCCPETFSELNCADSWQQAGFGTSDYFNNCSSIMSAATAAGSPCPDGNGCVGAITHDQTVEYVGACLNEPLLLGESYTLQLDLLGAHTQNFTDADFNVFMEYQGPIDLGPLDFTIYGSTSCSDLPLNSWECPVNTSGDWQIIGVQTLDIQDEWTTLQFELTFTDQIEAIVIGGPCDVPDGFNFDNGSPYLFYDNLILNLSSEFGATADFQSEFINTATGLSMVDGLLIDNGSGTSTDVGQICADQMILSTSDQVGVTHQWYADGVAMIGETDTSLVLNTTDINAETYQVRSTFSDNSCLTQSFSPESPELPLADFSLSENCFPATADLVNTSLSVSPIVTLEWTINGSPAGTEDSIEHMFEQASNMVELSITAENLCESIVSMDVDLAPSPIADFSFDDNPCVNSEVQFTDMSTVVTGNTILEWNWTINGEGVTDQDPLESYATATQDEVVLTVVTDQGCTGSASQIITVQGLPMIDFDSEPVCLNDSPVVVFENNSSIAAGSIASFEWDFGDQSTSLEVEPTHVYTVSGIYNVQLLATSSFGCQDSLMSEQIVSEVIADFTASDTLGCHPLLASFSSESFSNPGAIISTDWDMGNGASLSGAQVESTFNNFQDPDPLMFDISMIVTNEFGCSDVLVHENLIAVYPLPKAAFDVDVENANPAMTTVMFNNESVGAIEFLWDLGNGAFSSEENELAYYEEGETALVTLTANSEFGCQDTALFLIQVPAANYIYIPTSFTPDNDNVNDRFGPVITGATAEYLFEIYDRWGQLLFVSDSPGEKWNGSYRTTTDYYAPDGTYTYRLSLRFVGETEIVQREGLLTILR